MPRCGRVALPGGYRVFAKDNPEGEPTNTTQMDVEATPRQSQPRVLLLSLARAKERRLKSCNQLKADGVDFEIIESCDGLESPNLPQKCAGKMTNTQVGCYLSHLRAYERIIVYGWPYAVILEDDFKLLRQGELSQVLEGIPPAWDYLILHQFRFGDGGELRVTEEGEKFNRLQPCGVCTHGQVVSRKFAEYMLANFALPERGIDLALCEISKDPKFIFLELARPLIGLTGGPSFIIA